MIAKISVSALLFSLSGLIWAQAPSAAAETEIRQMTDEANRAFVAHDFRPFERIYSDRFISIKTRPIYNAKAQLIAITKYDAAVAESGKRLDYETLAFTSENIKTHIFGKTAIATSSKLNSWRYGDRRCQTRYQVTDVWRNEGGSWRLFVSHAVTFQCRPMPWAPLHPAVEALGSQLLPDKTLRADNDPDLAAVVAARTRAFASGFVFTNAAGEVLSGKTASAAVASALDEPEKDNSVWIKIDETAVYIFRTPAAGGFAGTKLQYTVVTALIDGRWQIVAAHCNKVD
ncbi:MAG: nuclear transport factor 2 family protein [Acidobacteriota bacterium]